VRSAQRIRPVGEIAEWPDTKGQDESLLQVLRGLANAWAWPGGRRSKPKAPDVIYWFGPVCAPPATKKNPWGEAKKNLPAFLADLRRSGRLH